MPLPRSPLVRYVLLAVGVISLYALLHTNYIYVPGAEPRVNACFTVLARNHDWRALRDSMRQIEDRFNSRYNYPYVFLNDKPFSAEFINMTRSMTRAQVHYGQIPTEHWSYPEWIDQSKAARRRKEMHEHGVMYGDSESYRHMCRFESGLFFQHPLMQQFDYYWRLEPGIEYKCDINYDPFMYMKKNKIRYAWTIAIYELMDTIPTLWSSVKKFMHARPDLIPETNSLWWVSRDNGTSYNGCHFWSNFEIADLSFYRSKEYQAFFDFLDHEGGFFYERWGDAPIHSIAAALFLQKVQVHWFKDIGYYHPGWQHCPSGDAWLANRCTCDPNDKSKTITNANWGKCSHQWELLPDTPAHLRKAH
ncbi:hypothetical protein GGH12_002111 [Coemansia sp. RSA 1822]|nr:hypothetical protein GGH12_002111 [Coemansia sp. RSA 1822]